MRASRPDDPPTANGHALLTVLGKAPKSARYTLGGRECRASTAPAALVELLPTHERPDRVLVLCTPEAKRESLPKLAEALPDGIRVHPLEVTVDSTPEGVNDYLQTICRAIASLPEIELSVDVTHGYRHLSFLTYLAVLYVAALRRINMRGAYYGLFREDAPSPFLDLLPLAELPQWAHALRVLHTTGSALPIAELLRAKPSNPSTGMIVRDLERFSVGYLSGLPLEVGGQAHRIHTTHLKPFRKLLASDHALPLASELVDLLDETMRRFDSSGSVKGEIGLSEEELDRQAELIEDLLWSKNVASALGLMDEWTVSWVMLRLGTGPDWLDHRRARREAANRLGAFAAVYKDSQLRSRLTAEQRVLGEFWKTLTDLRNGYHHHGMRKQDMVRDRAPQTGLERVSEYWNQTLRRHPEFPLALDATSSPVVLVSPIGKSAGVLSSAIQACRARLGEPDLCLIVCSRESEGTIDAALRHANYASRIEWFRFDDPYGGGRREIERVVEAARGHLVGARDVAVNITGGTTLMGLATEALAVKAARLACPVHRFGLIDRRPPEHQARDPFKEGSPFWLDE